MTSPRTFLLPLAAAGLLGGAGGVAVDHALGSSDTTRTVIQRPATSTATVADDTAPAAAGAIYAGAKDAVAYITARGPSGGGTGTGFVISKDGQIVTNAHVIDGATDITVKVGDGKEIAADVVGVDRSSDIALLDVDATDLPTLSLGDSSAAAVGDEVYAIGNPYGLDRTLTTGVVSALQRSIQAPDGYTISNVLQTDAALNPGNSGGPLLDSYGRVIGVNSQIESATRSNTGVGFAVPSNTVKRVVAQLNADGTATHAYLGVSTTDAPDGGAAVAEIAGDTPAAAAGIQRGDVITKLGSEPVATSEALSAAVDAHAPGDTVALTVRRGQDIVTVDARLSSRPL
jgi:putative serine protease PepD